MLGKWSVFLIILILLNTVWATAQEPPALDDLQAGEWNGIAPGGDTICSRGTDYEFFVRPGDPEKLMIHFQGGGACWNGANCREGMLQTFDPATDESDVALMEYGIFDTDDPENPVADFSTVFVSYCTGDIHIGASTTTYDDITIEHRGVANAEAVLDWVYDNYAAPQEVFVTGCSAGSYGSIFYAPSIAEHYPDAQFTHLGDAGLGAIFPGWDGLEQWGFGGPLAEYFPEIEIDDLSEFQITMLYTAAAARIPDGVFSETSTAEDDVQIGFYALMGGPLSEWDEVVEEHLATKESLPNFRSFISEGAIHCLTPQPTFSEFSAEGVTLSDWLAALLEGQPLDSVAEWGAE